MSDDTVTSGTRLDALAIGPNSSKIINIVALVCKSQDLKKISGLEWESEMWLDSYSSPENFLWTNAVSPKISFTLHVLKKSSQNVLSLGIHICTFEIKVTNTQPVKSIKIKTNLVASSVVAINSLQVFQNLI